MKHARVLIILLMGICCGALAADPVMRDLTTKAVYDPSARFPNSGTFDFVFETPAMPHDPKVDKVALESHLRQAVIEALEGKGYVFRGTLESEPKFRVRIGASLNGAGNLPVTGERSSAPPEWLAAADDAPGLRQAVAVVDIIEPKTGETIWRGVGEAGLLFNGTISEEDKTTRTQSMIDRILDAFPPTP